MKVSSLCFRVIALFGFMICSLPVVAGVYLYNTSGYDIAFLYTSTMNKVDNETPIILPNGQKFDLGNNWDKVSQLSIRRSGFGSYFSSWHRIDARQMVNNTYDFFRNTKAPSGFMQNACWKIESAGMGWDVRVTGFTTPK